jgi:predicted Ser/Thr protein kinase
MDDSSEILDQLNSDIQQEFEATRRIMSFPEFLDLFTEHPRQYARNSVQYLRDCFLYYGTETKSREWGEVTHFNLFDAPFDEGRERVVGQEHAQETIFNLIENFVRQGKSDKLIMLHGPNGSAKSSMVETIIRGMEHYSRTEEGALYRFNWIFPGDNIARGASIGFEGFSTRKAEETDLDTFAYLDEEEIDATVPSDMNDHPLLLIPPEQRRELLETHIDDLVIPGVSRDTEPEVFQQRMLDGPLEETDRESQPFVASDYVLYGDVSHMSRQIFDALLTAYNGEIEKVLRHVQVERFFISRRYRRGAVVVEPQRAVDAGLRQLTVDKSLSALPTSLQNQTIFEPFGDLVDANRGLIDYDDLFKRPKELNQYLLATSEKGTVSLENRILHLDMTLLATGNEDYLDAFKQTPDYSSFKGRMELVRVPYLLDYQVEELIYDEQLATVDFIKPLAPHTMHIAAIWAVLTRMKRPDATQYDSSIRSIISKLTPLQKADLYAEGRVPEEIGPEQSRELRAAIADLREEDAGTSEYEGRRGASPREMKMILLNASQNDSYPTLSPLAVFEELSELVKDPSVFPFLQQEANGPYHRHEEFIETVQERYLEILDTEIRDSMGLIEERQYEELFDNYIDHINAWLKGEKVYNEVTDSREEPDEDLMERVEGVLEFEEDLEAFREDLISSIAAYSIEHVDEEVDYREIFPNIFDAMHEAFYEERQEQVRDIQEDILTYFEGDRQNLSESELEQVESTIANLRETYGYNEAYTREAVAFLLSNRYR